MERRAWDDYERRWKSLSADSDVRKLSFSSIPWPVVRPPRSPSELDLASVKAFLFSRSHSLEKSAKQRVRDAMLRFHPDRFEGRWMSKVRDSERAAVKEGIGRVARVLNDAMAELHY